MGEQASAELISLPQGGGSLRGLGETFQPDLHTGTGAYRIPLELPPGRGGMRPDLALSYSTGNPNGPFGLGWTLNVPSVRRKTAKRVPTYDARDVLLLSGTEDLVPVPGGGAGEQRYRPRTEGLFARIVWRDDDRGDYWEVWSGDGLRSRYGTQRREDATTDWHDPAVVVDPMEPHRVAGWLLTETVDTLGNRIQYSYLSDGAQRYLAEVRYVDYGDLAAPRFLVSLRLRYAPRPDPFTDRRVGFAVRTAWRCTGIETWVDAGATVQDSVRVRAVALRYADEDGVQPPSRVSLLSRVTVTGHDGARAQSLPPTDFTYTGWDPSGRRYSALTTTVGEAPAVALGRPDVDLVDLFGDGLPSVVQLGDVARYWRNRGDGSFDLPRSMPFVPTGARLGAPGVQLGDMDGDGRADLLVTEGARAGYWPLGRDGGFDPHGYVAYRRAPPSGLGDPELRLIDLDGDGVVDALRTGVDVELYYNDPRAGWSGAQVRSRGASFPDVSFADPWIRLGDMTGDGLTDVVSVHERHVEYWPYLGHGRWGQRVVMADPPRLTDFTGGDPCDPRQLLIGDVDGDGCADLVYVGRGEVIIWINRGGQGFADPVVVRGTPSPVGALSVQLADMLGTGTSGVLWTYDVGAQQGSAYKFLDPTGGVKPYLLASIDDHTGSRTTIEYGTSTRFAVEDARAGRPWTTTLPFPVQVVRRVSVQEHFSGRTHVAEYAYHDGYWDGAEREFVGFGRVDHRDAVSYALLSAAPPRYSPPTETRTWFHQGAVGREFGAWEPIDVAGAFWPGDPQLLGLVDLTAVPRTLPRRALRDVVRSLAGHVLRREVYALDGDARQHRPYTVDEHRYAVRPVLDGRVADDAAWLARPVVHPHLIAQRTTQWERGHDPMTTATFVGGHDQYGRPAYTMDVAVPRHGDPRTSATAAEPYLATLTEVSYATRDDPARYLLDRVVRTIRYEVVNDGTQTLTGLRDAAVDGTLGRRLLGLELTRYDGPAFDGLPAGQLGDHALAVRVERLAFTPGMLVELTGDTTPPPYLTSDTGATWPDHYPQTFRSLLAGGAGYVWQNADEYYLAGWYVPTRRARYDVHDGAGGRGLAIAERDAFGHQITIGYDRFAHFITQVTDAAGLARSGEYDYRVMQPRLVTDPNGNRTRAGYTPLGLLAWVAVQGKDGEEQGDTVEQPGTRYEYGLSAWDDSPPAARQPLWVHTIKRVVDRWDVVRAERARRTEAGLPPPTDADLAALFPPDEREQFPERFARMQQYSDGFARPLQLRTQADTVVLDDLGLPADMDASPADTVAHAAMDPAAPPVVVSGWQAYDDKGRPVEAWEPFDDTGWAYVPANPRQLSRPHTSTYYDPRGVTERVVHPDGAEDRVVPGVPDDLEDPTRFAPTPWERYTYDGNDNAGRTHPEASQAWRSHHDTPSCVRFDALSRVVESVDRTKSEAHVTRTRYDIDGRVVAVTDALGRVAARSTYDLLGHVWMSESLDAGVVRQIPDAAGAVVERSDLRGALVLVGHDADHRAIRHWARERPEQAATLRVVTVFAEDPASGLTREQAASANLLGRPYRRYDEAGLVTDLRFDLRGNCTQRERRVLSTDALLSGLPPTGGDWTGTAFTVDWEPPAGRSLGEHAEGLLDDTTFAVSMEFGPAGRREQLTCPTDAEGTRRVVRTTYGRSGHLVRVEVDKSAVVEQIVRDARGQRRLALLGNGVMTRYAYDPRTFRLARQRTENAVQVAPLQWRGNGAPLLDQGFGYDLIGNVVAQLDRTPGGGTPPGDPDRLDRVFAYDELYRLLSATGRECAVPLPAPWSAAPRCIDPTATREYHQTYRHDAVGNLLGVTHQAGGSTWTREATLGTGNRLATVTTAGTSYDYTHDAAGNLVTETTSRRLEWDAFGRLATFRVQASQGEPSTYTQYRYDPAGQRVVKLVRDQGGNLAVTVYLEGVFERLVLIRPSSTSTHDALHIMDDSLRVATFRIGDPVPGDPMPQLVHHVADHLGSSTLVLDADGDVLSREEFSPYGETTFGSHARKRYRFLGKERDEESGLSYHGARYYAPWLGRWISPDPLGLADGPNPYAYAQGRPTVHVDPTGLAAKKPQTQASTKVKQPAKAGTAGQVGRYKALKGVKIDGSKPTIREHLMPGAQLQALTKDPKTGAADYRNHGPEYLNDNVYLNPKKDALAKTHEHGSVPSDNARTSQIKAKQALAAEGKGPGATLNEDLMVPSIKRAVETGTPEPVANKTALEQAGNLFGRFRLREAGARIRSWAGETVGGVVGVVAPMAFTMVWDAARESNQDEVFRIKVTPVERLTQDDLEFMEWQCWHLEFDEKGEKRWEYRPTLERKIVDKFWQLMHVPDIVLHNMEMERARNTAYMYGGYI